MILILAATFMSLEFLLFTVKYVGALAGVLGGIAGIWALVLRVYAWLQKRTDEIVLEPRRQQQRRFDEMYGMIGKDGKLTVMVRENSVILARGEVRSRTLMCSMGVGEIERDAQGHVVRVNVAMCRLVGRPQEDFLGYNWISLIHPDDRDRVTEEWLHAKEPSRTTIEFTSRWLTPGGSAILTRSLANAMLDSNGSIAGWVCVVQPHPTMADTLLAAAQDHKEKT